MGICYSAKMLVVHDGDILSLLQDMLELEEYSHCDNVGEIMDELDLSSASPWYDACQEDCIIGFKISNPNYEDLIDQESSWWGKLNNYATKLEELFGEGNISLEAHQNIY